jgi:hypothetical protein
MVGFLAVRAGAKEHFQNQPVDRILVFLAIFAEVNSLVVVAVAMMLQNAP